MNRKELLNLVNKIKKNVQKKSSIVVCDYIHLIAKEGKLTLIHHNLEVEYTINASADLKDNDVFLCPLFLEKTLKPLKCDDVEIDGDVLVHSRGKIKLSSKIFEKDDIPCFDLGVKKGVFSVKSNDVLFASKYCGNDDHRPVMKCVNINMTHIAATNAMKLVKIKTDEQPNDIYVNIISGVFPLLSKNELYLGTTYTKHTKLINASETIIFRNIEAQYPDYNAVLPTTTTGTLTVSTAEIKEGINVSLLSTDYTKRISIKENNVHANDVVRNVESEYTLSAEIEGDTNFSVNGEILADILGDIQEKEVNIKCSGYGRPITIEENDRLFLLMPLKGN
jgi:DNA polymerase III sliding clamp (beta) subunit (PCNA family)